MKEDLQVEASLHPLTSDTFGQGGPELWLIGSSPSYPWGLTCEEGVCVLRSIKFCFKDWSHWLGPINLNQQEDFAVMLAYFENGVGQFGIIYDVMKGDCYHGGGAFPPCRNNEPLPPFLKRSPQRNLAAGNSGMFEAMSGSWRIWGDRLQSVSTVVRPLVLPRSYRVVFWPILPTRSHGDYAGQYQGKVWDRLLTVSGEPADFKTRQPVMMVPIEMQEVIQSYIYERKEN